MKKNNYSKPQLLIAECSGNGFCATSSVKLFGSDDKLGSKTGQLGNERRGSWGDLWEKDEEAE